MHLFNPMRGRGITALLLCWAFLSCAEDRPRLRPAPETGRNMKTGPEVGQKIPAFSLKDHVGQTQTFDTLRGPKGLVLAFVRSADW